MLLQCHVLLSSHDPLSVHRQVETCLFKANLWVCQRWDSPRLAGIQLKSPILSPLIGSNTVLLLFCNYASTEIGPMGAYSRGCLFAKISFL